MRPRQASSPIAASQEIDWSKRDAVGESSMRGPKKLSKGAAPARQPAESGSRRSCTSWRM
ncbi:MAG: hypothetical protein FJX69_18440 [Alphaproteobacteria bacterium]|nr:hypothetical protein [Alphaproteobacteria bacterium]